MAKGCRRRTRQGRGLEESACKQRDRSRRRGPPARTEPRARRVPSERSRTARWIRRRLKARFGRCPAGLLAALTAFRLPTSSAATHGCTGTRPASKRRRAPSRRSRSCARPPAGSGDSQRAAPPDDSLPVLRGRASYRRFSARWSPTYSLPGANSFMSCCDTEFQPKHASRDRSSSLHLPPMCGPGRRSDRTPCRPPSWPRGVALPAAIFAHPRCCPMRPMSDRPLSARLSASAWQFVEFALFAARPSASLMIRLLIGAVGDP